MELRTFLGEMTMAASAGVQPMGSVFNAIPAPAGPAGKDIAAYASPSLSRPVLEPRARGGRWALVPELCGRGA